ncbi:hypothetical protein QA600_20545 [Natronococcus sp. A-GB1]|uniref:hypothetical protein n=1 Tax=Natronococcus sp. A-GB1 TaxID=3037648 RepID=UPI00241DEF18|nr:hypothetical protein [Natronococcus sp. A-GB1]MDG5761717.1 hypothetical protein [Natronococcus sp. A-GB1]
MPPPRGDGRAADRSADEPLAWRGRGRRPGRDRRRRRSEDVDPETARKRVHQVQRLLSAADDPDHEDAVAHCEAARELCAAVLSS